MTRQDPASFISSSGNCQAGLKWIGSIAHHLVGQVHSSFHFVTYSKSFIAFLFYILNSNTHFGNYTTLWSLSKVSWMLHGLAKHVRTAGKRSACVSLFFFTKSYFSPSNDVYTPAARTRCFRQMIHLAVQVFSSW